MTSQALAKAASELGVGGIVISILESGVGAGNTIRSKVLRF
jgi:hypothetical protein